MSCFIARFIGPSQDGRKESNIYDKRESNRKDKGRFPKSWLSSQLVKIETYKRQIDKFLLAERNSNEKTVRAVNIGWKIGKDLVDYATRRCKDES